MHISGEMQNLFLLDRPAESTFNAICILMKIAFFEVNGKQHGTLFFDRAHRHVAYEDAASFYAGMNTTVQNSKSC